MNPNNLQTTPPRAKLEPVTIHPLSEEACSAASSPINTASLIQSAVRSILDGSSPGTNVSDDDSCSNNGCRNTSSHNLQSLQARVVPAMPDEQDRKRFLGCLAAVLAKTYSYDNLEDMEDGQIDSEAMAYYDRSESCEDFDDSDRTIDYSVSGSFDFGADDSQHSGGPSNRNNNTHHSAKKALSRHRRRRYNVLSELLLSSADLLMVEKGSAKAFLPMLSKLMFPQTQEFSVDETESGFDGRTKHDTTNRKQKSQDVVSQCIDNVDFLRPFLESMTPGSGFRCLALCLLQHLLRNEKGYDARIRHAFKEVGVFVLIHDLKKDPVDIYMQDKDSRGRQERSKQLIELATRKFESLEHWIARELLKHSSEAKVPTASESRKGGERNASQSNAYEYEQMMRRLKIGGAAVVAGALFAVSGGLAAPMIATSVAAIAGGTAATAAAAAVLTSTAAVTAIFGVGGGSLAAYKMQRRTQGLTEFNFIKVSGKERTSETNGVEAELFSTICLSGWLRDKFDFQRPWGVEPTNPPLKDRIELLQRFYQIYRPSHVMKCEKILEQWKGEEKELWKLLEQKYGRNPDNLFPFVDGPRIKADLTLEQREIIENLFSEIVHGSVSSETLDQKHAFEAASPTTDTSVAVAEGRLLLSTSDRHCYTDCTSDTTATNSSFGTSGSEYNGNGLNDIRLQPEDSVEAVPAHIRNIWDYKANYGGELYTVKWESSLLQELCDSVTDLAFDVVSGGTAQLLKHTALSTLLSAFAWPWALVNAANLIDGTWTLAVERSDEAGKELARSLLFSGAGNRPVTLIGYSFGARVVYACLKELARYQEAWEDHQEQLAQGTQNRFRRQTQKSDDMFSKMREPASIVEDAILMGLPNHLSLSSWKACRQVVAGRLVNCFSQKDLILSLMFQLKRFGGLKPVCGVCAVKVAGVENVDVTDLVIGHQDYTTCIGDILKKVRHGQPFSSRFFIKRSVTTKHATHVSKLDI